MILKYTCVEVYQSTCLDFPWIRYENAKLFAEPYLKRLKAVGIKTVKDLQHEDLLTWGFPAPYYKQVKTSYFLGENRFLIIAYIFAGCWNILDHIAPTIHSRKNLRAEDKIVLGM